VQTTTGTTTFVYDGDGQRVLQTRPDTSWVAYVGALMEVETDYITTCHSRAQAQ
jgi:YD repeat-containing protein